MWDVQGSLEVKVEGRRAMRVVDAGRDDGSGTVSSSAFSSLAGAADVVSISFDYDNVCNAFKPDNRYVFRVYVDDVAVVVDSHPNYNPGSGKSSCNGVNGVNRTGKINVVTGQWLGWN